jgi:hypothetical protein
MCGLCYDRLGVVALGAWKNKKKIERQRHRVRREGDGNEKKFKS